MENQWEEVRTWRGKGANDKGGTPSWVQSGQLWNFSHPPACGASRHVLRLLQCTAQQDRRAWGQWDLTIKRSKSYTEHSPPFLKVHLSYFWDWFASISPLLQQQVLIEVTNQPKSFIIKRSITKRILLKRKNMSVKCLPELLPRV